MIDRDSVLATGERLLYLPEEDIPEEVTITVPLTKMTLFIETALVAIDSAFAAGIEQSIEDGSFFNLVQGVNNIKAFAAELAGSMVVALGDAVE